MCGIAGIFAYNNDAPPVQGEGLSKMSSAMVSRGPDGSGLWIGKDERVGLAHRRLSIIDLSETSAQPMSTQNGEYQIVFNGEIYNYQTLRESLEAKGYRFVTQSDTEVLLHLYAEYGEEMVTQLRGMFAFGIWDERKKGLFLARDPFGIKPLYFADNGSTVHFASQVKAILANQLFQVSPEPAGHVGFFLWGFVPEPYTLFKEIRSLGAGSTLWIDEQGAHPPKAFFQISDHLSAHEGIGRFSPQECKERLQSILLDSVRHHLIADVPVGVFLSSGLDSATLAALASELALGDLHTVTLGFREYRGTEKDETQLAELVSQHYGTKHESRWVSGKDFQEDLDRLFDAMDQPSVDGVNTYFVSKAAAESGLKATLSGLGGDEIFGGYPGFTQIPKLVGIMGALPYPRGFGTMFRRVSIPFLKHCSSPKYSGLFEYGKSYSGAYLLRRGLFMPWELPGILDGDLVRNGMQELQPLLRLEETLGSIGKSRLKVSALEMSWYMRNQLLRDSDWAGMAHSLEIRVPLVDVGLFKSLVPLLKAPSPPGKLDMASTPHKALPQEVLHRKKTGFNIPVRKWLQQKAGNQNRGRGIRGWAQTVYRELNGGAK